MHYRFRCYASRYGTKNSIARKRISIKSQIIRNRSADKNLFSTMIVVSDFAGVPELTKYSNILRGCGRHNAFSVMLATQKYHVVPLAIRLNASALFMSRQEF